MPLALTRKKYETIKIGNDIYVTVLTVNKHNSVKLGIVAPRDIPIIRIEPPLSDLGYRTDLELTEKEKELNTPREGE